MNKKIWPTHLFFPIPLLIPIIFLFTVEPAWSANHFVRPNGTGTSCSQPAPCLFTTAIANASPRDYIIFRQGTYTRTASSVLRIEKEIYLLGGWDGSPNGSLIINPELYPSILDGGNLRPVVHILGPIKTIISGFTIQNGNARDLPEQTVVCEGVMTTGCGGGIYVAEAEALIAKNKILNNQANDGKGLGGGVHLERASETNLLNNLFQGNQAKKGGALFFLEHTNITIQDNVFDNNSAGTASGLLGKGAATIGRNLFQNHPGMMVVGFGEFQGAFKANRLINNNVNYGLFIETGSPTLSNNFIARSGLMYALGASGLVNAVIEHNTLVGEDIGNAIRVISSTPLGLNNNIISGYPIGIDATGSSAMVIARHTLFDSSVTTPGNNVNFINTLVGDPGFKDPAANDFHIRFTSAARDAGTANFITTTQDIDGDPRPIGNAPDIGADEFNPAFLYLPLINK